MLSNLDDSKKKIITNDFCEIIILDTTPLVESFRVNKFFNRSAKKFLLSFINQFFENSNIYKKSKICQNVPNIFF